MQALGHQFQFGNFLKSRTNAPPQVGSREAPPLNLPPTRIAPQGCPTDRERQSVHPKPYRCTAIRAGPRSSPHMTDSPQNLR